MSTKTVPGSVVNRRSPFPEGHFRGTISETQESQSEDGNYGAIAFQLINNTAVDAEKEPGARPHFVKLTTYVVTKDKRGKDVTHMTADADPEDENTPWGVRLAVGQWAQMAAVLGAGEVQQDGGVSFNDDLETFIEQVKSGQYDGEEVDFVVSHRPEKKDGKIVKGGRTYVDTAFLVPEAADGADADSEEETAEETTDDAETEEVPEETDDEEDDDTPPAPAKSTRSLVTSAKKASSKPPVKGSGKPKFVRKGGKR